MPMKPVQVFYSYSHKDEKLRDVLEYNLVVLKRQGVISQWHDRKIASGSAWSDEISTHLDQSEIILLLISQHFLASDYCYEVELKRAMELHETGKATVIPIILQSCEWRDASFAKLNALPKDGRPVMLWSNRQNAFTDIARGIREAVNERRIKLLEYELERKKTIVVADDEQVISNTLSIILRQLGYTVYTAYSGEATLDLANAFKPAFVLSDVIMTGMTGIEAGIQIREAMPGCTVILFSGQAATEDLIEKAKSLGHDFEIHRKPWHPNDIISCLTRAELAQSGPIANLNA